MESLAWCNRILGKAALYHPKRLCHGTGFKWKGQSRSFAPKPRDGGVQLRPKRKTSRLLVRYGPGLVQGSGMGLISQTVDFVV